jgi:hypothetical protein
MVWDGYRVGRIALVELGVVRAVEGDRGRLQGRQKWLGGTLDGEAPVSCSGHVVGTRVRDGLAVWRPGGRESIFKIRHTNEFCGKSKLARETARASGRLGEPRRTYKRNSAGRGPGRAAG